MAVRPINAMPKRFANLAPVTEVTTTTAAASTETVASTENK